MGLVDVRLQWYNPDDSNYPYNTKCPTKEEVPDFTPIWFGFWSDETMNPCWVQRFGYQVRAVWGLSDYVWLPFHAMPSQACAGKNIDAQWEPR